MKWFWWVGGAALYLVIKNEVGIESPGMWILVVVILVAASMLGQKSEAAGKKREQEDRDRQASEAAHEALKDLHRKHTSSEAKDRPQQ